MGRVKCDATDGIRNRGVVILADGAELGGVLTIPERTRGIVIFANEGGSGRFDPRNRCVAGRLNEAGYATLLFDLLTPSEEIVIEQGRAILSHFSLLASRLMRTVGWVRSYDLTIGIPIALFGVGIGAAAMLMAAAKRPDDVRAVVSLGGQLDQARSLGQVRAPTLLIVSADDPATLKLNKAAQKRILAECELKTVKNKTVQGETHPFSEPGKLEEVSHLSREWFGNKLA